MSRQIYFLKVTLADVTPPVWRRIAVPGGYTLDRVHRTIQLAMGWQDCHLHSFEIGAAQYGQPDPDGMLELHDELDTRLDGVAACDDRFLYIYDFGDWWEHHVVVEDVLPAGADERYPACTDGAGGCPPEDVGGAYGYDRFRTAITDAADPEHRAMVEWLGREFVPDDFDASRATALMRRMA